MSWASVPADAQMCRTESLIMVQVSLSLRHVSWICSSRKMGLLVLALNRPRRSCEMIRLVQGRRDLLGSADIVTSMSCIRDESLYCSRRGN